MRLTTLLETVTCALLLTAPASSEGIGVTGRISTTGLGIELTASPLEPINLRIGYSALDYDDGRFASDVAYHFDLTLRTAEAMIDLHPGGGAFRLSGGVIWNGIRLDGRGTATGDQTIGGTTYRPDQLGVLKMKARYANTVAPYLGLGFGNAARGRHRMTLAFDLGVIFAGKPTVDLTASARTIGLEDDLAKEEADLTDDFRRYRWYPVVALGLSVRLGTLR